MKKNYFFIICFVMIAIVSGCIGGTKTSIATVKETAAVNTPALTPVETEEFKYWNISPQQAFEMTMNTDLYILDVRTQQEYDEGHIRDAKLIPLQNLNAKLGEIPKEKNIVVYSNDSRSINASEILINNGFTQVYNMEEGIMGWSKAGFEIVK